MARKAAQREVLKRLTFREALARFMKDATPRGAERPNFNAADQAHLDRWVNDSRAEEVWQKIQKLVVKSRAAARAAAIKAVPDTPPAELERHGSAVPDTLLAELERDGRAPTIEMMVRARNEAAQALSALGNVNASTREGIKQLAALQKPIKAYDNLVRYERKRLIAEGKQCDASPTLEDRQQAIESALRAAAEPRDLNFVFLIVLLARGSAENVASPKVIADQEKRRSHRLQERIKNLQNLAKVWREIAISQKKVEEVEDREHGWPEDLAKAWPELVKEKISISKGAFKKAEMYELEARFWRKFSQCPPPKRKYLLSRHSGSRKQRFFMQAIGTFLIELCGRPMDYETAVLNDIAFDTAEATTPGQARSARRPSTQSARLKSHKSAAQNAKKMRARKMKKHVATTR